MIEVRADDNVLLSQGWIASAQQRDDVLRWARCGASRVRIFRGERIERLKVPGQQLRQAE